MQSWRRAKLSVENIQYAYNPEIQNFVSKRPILGFFWKIWIFIIEYIKKYRLLLKTVRIFAPIRAYSPRPYYHQEVMQIERQRRLGCNWFAAMPKTISIDFK
jgi:hypothetical protein